MSEAAKKYNLHAQHLGKMLKQRYGVKDGRKERNPTGCDIDPSFSYKEKTKILRKKYEMAMEEVKAT